MQPSDLLRVRPSISRLLPMRRHRRRVIDDDGFDQRDSDDYDGYVNIRPRHYPLIRVPLDLRPN